MKKIFSLLLILVLFVPILVRAEETPEVISSNNEPVNVYIFRSDTCGYCKALMEWLNSEKVQDEYGKYFKIVDFEVSNSKNAELMQKVKDYFNVTSEGVPYIVVGTYDYPNGFASDVTIDEEGTTMGDQLLAQIMEVYLDDNRFDIFETLNVDPNKKEDNNVAVGIISGVVILTIVGVIIVARKNS